LAPGRSVLRGLDIEARALEVAVPPGDRHLVQAHARSEVELQPLAVTGRGPVRREVAVDGFRGGIAVVAARTGRSDLECGYGRWDQALAEQRLEEVVVAEAQARVDAR